ncbi:glycosyltransferase family 2 protein [Halorubrum sp. N11]|uniref:glycosyltransferase family 2 protein n=1 Tax=Halorubrum sp. N11 TaxID=3402276 RepID=UPI003EB82F5E
MSTNPTSPDSPKVGIVILNWNGYSDTSHCLDSISAIKYSNYQTYVVDNNSTDGSLNRLEKEYGQTVFIRKKENTGFADGCNVGIKEAIQNQCDYVLLLNNDMTVKKDFLSRLVETAESNQDVAAVGGTIYYPDKEKIWYSGGEIHPRTAKIERKTEIPSMTEYPTEWIISALMLLNVDYLQSHGYLNDDYFFGSEDQEFCYLAQKRGWKLLVNPESEVVHDIHSTSGSLNGFQVYHNTYNRLYFAENCLRKPDRAIFYIYFLINRIGFVLYAALNQRVDLIISVHQALSDYRQDEQRKATEYIK